MTQIDPIDQSDLLINFEPAEKKESPLKDFSKDTLINLSEPKTNTGFIDYMEVILAGIIGGGLMSFAQKKLQGNTFLTHIEAPNEESKKLKIAQFSPHSKEDEENVHALILMLAKSSYLTHFISLKSLEKKIKHIPPFYFLGLIFSNNERKKAIQTILEKGFYNTFRRNGFVNPLVAEISKLANPHDHLINFSEQIQINPKKLQPFFNQKNWIEMIDFLVMS